MSPWLPQRSSLIVIIYRTQHSLIVITHLILAYVRRSPSDGAAWWMSGTADCLYFFVLFRGTEHGQIRLQKMAGDLNKEHTS